MNKFFNKRNIFIAGNTLLIGGYSYWIIQKNKDKHKTNNTYNKNNFYTYDEVKKHNKPNDTWITYKDSVYNISDFMDNHPGGKDKLMLAAGKAIDPYWNLYRQHNKEIEETILKPMKIGLLKDYKQDNTFNDLYINDPHRSNDLYFHNSSPCNAETDVTQIMDNWITPNELWYIRNHNPVPNIDANNFELEIIDINNKTKLISYDEITNLKKLKTEITATIQCGGNRRSELNILQKTSGTPWKFGAISNAQWGGILLKDLFKYLNINTNDTNIKHIHFKSIDGVQASIPIEKALNSYGDVLLAYEMNGEVLPRDHGFPLRMIVPGYVGIRNIKWINSICLSDKEIEGTWQKGISYKGVPHYIKNAKEINIENIQPIYETPIQSCIVNVIHDSDNNDNIIQGFAYSGGGRNIIRVDVSCDDGATWHMAELLEGNKQAFNQAWSWTFWEYKCHKSLDKKKYLCKAIDSSYNIQPSTTLHIWNMRGLLNNSYHYLNNNEPYLLSYNTLALY